MSTKAAIYVRVSTTEQAEKGYSLETQLTACRQKAKELGAINIKEFIDDGYSGEFIDRPALTLLRNEVIHKDFNTVVVYDPDRLARNLAHQLIITEDIEKAGASLQFVSVNFEQSHEGKLFYSIRGAISAYEKEKIKERTLRGKRGKATQGKIIHNAKPFGYSFDAANSMYVINEDEADIVRMIFDYIVKDKLGTARICKELNALGIPSPRAKTTWIVSSIHRILTNTMYKGIIYSMKYQYQKVGLKKRTRVMRPEEEWIPVTVPAIIDEVTWQAAQRQLKSNKSESKRNLKYDHLLNGLVVCAKCGRKMVIAHSGSGGYKAYYACLSQRSASYMYSGQERCKARRIPTTQLDDYVYTHLRSMSKDDSLIKTYLQSIPEKKDIKQLKNKISRLNESEKKLNKQRDTVLRWFRQQMISEQEADGQLKEIRIQMINIESTKKQYQDELDSASSGLNTEQIALRIKSSFAHELSCDEDKKNAIRSVLDKVIVERTDNTFARGSKPELDVQLKFL